LQNTPNKLLRYFIPLLALAGISLLLYITFPVAEAVETTDTGILLQQADSLLAENNLEAALYKYLTAADKFALSGNKRQQATALAQAGMVQYNLDKPESALYSWQLAAALYDSIGSKRDQAVILKQIGWIFDDDADFQSALKYYQSALNLAELTADSSLQAQCLNNVGIAYYYLTQFDPALTSLNQSLKIRTGLNDRRGSIKTLNNLGMVYDAQSDHERALSCYQSSLKLSREIGDVESESQVLGNIGLVYRTRSDYETALDYYRKSLKLKRTTGDSLGQAITLNNIGVVFDLLGNSESALEYYSESLAISRSIEDFYGQGDALDNIGSAWLALGNPDSALSAYAQSLAIKTELGNLHGQGVSHNNIGLLYASIGETDKARKHYTTDLEICRNLQDQSGECVTLINLGLLDADDGKFEEAADLLQQALSLANQFPGNNNYIYALTGLGKLAYLEGNDQKAVSFYKPAIDSLETIRGKLTSAEFKTGLSSRSSDFYAELIASLFRQGKQIDAFNYSERARARTFLDILAERPSATPGKFQQKSLGLKKENTAPGIFSGISVSSLTLPEIQKQLPPETALIEYFITSDQTYIWLVTSEETHTFSIKISEKSLIEKVKGFRSSLLFSGASDVRSQQLYDLLIASVIPDLQQKDVILVPYGILHYLPFAALIDAEGKPFSSQVRLSQLPSASVLPYLHKHDTTSTLTFLGLADPINSQYPGDPLPFAVKEVNMAAGLFKSDAAYSGKSATENLLKLRCSKYDIIHLACHTELNDAAPMFSKLILAPSSGEDGTLTVYEIFNLNLNAHLVTLSGCETGLGHLTNGDELIGLTRAFLDAGAGAVLASYWPVEDEATAFFMKSFYINMRRSGLAEALQIAQNETRILYQKSPAWASFFLIGNHN